MADGIAPERSPGEVVQALTADAARALTDEVKADAEALWRKLLGLYEGKAHLALGYSSWHAYCAAEFGFGKSHAYRLLDAGRVHRVIPHVGNEPQARELAPVLRSEGEEALVEVWHDIEREHGYRVAAPLIKELVEKWIKGKIKEQRPRPEPDVVRLGRRTSEKEIRMASAGDTRIRYIEEALQEAWDLLLYDWPDRPDQRVATLEAAVPYLRGFLAEVEWALARRKAQGQPSA